MNDSQPLVSVRLMTYNQGIYIKDAMDGIFNQITKFNIEVVVGDDLSRDNTIDVIKTYKDTDRINVKILDHNNAEYIEERNRMGRLYNFIDTLKHCTGKYIALLDGDDYWTDPYKLQKQVNYLNLHHNCNICGHRIKLNKENKILPLIQEGDIIYLQHELAQENRLRTVSVMFRNIIDDIPNSVYDYPVADWYLYMILLQTGYAYILDDVMAHYRIHDKGIWSNMSEKERMEANLLVYHLFIRDFPHLKNLLSYFSNEQVKQINSSDSLSLCRKIRYKIELAFNIN